MTQAYLYATAVIRDLKKFEPAILYKNFQGGSAGVYGILNEFLERVHRGDYDFTGGNFVYYVWFERLSIYQLI